MRLINTESLQIHEFIDAEQAPGYAILSHCWGDEEVSFKEYTKGSRQDGAGYRKVVESCSFAKKRSQQWIWIDTCCIDKRSSAELSEAINSMFAWYQAASECYVYLADVSSGSNNDQDLELQFSQSRWFTRGWTLQELIAPELVTFLTRDWEEIGQKRFLHWDVPLYLPRASRVTCATLSSITGIPTELLDGTDGLRQYSAAQRLSWAADRITTRVEDMAYCLLGMFNINMPLLYGEGHKAFQRLQIEILQRNGDESVLMWDKAHDFKGVSFSEDLLARSPENLGTIPDIRRATTHDRPLIAITPFGVEMSLTSRRPGVFRFSGEKHLFVVRLNCATKIESALRDLVPCVMFIQPSHCGHFRRVLCNYTNGKGNIHTEDQLPHPDGWVQEEGQETLFIHVNEDDSIECAQARILEGRVSYKLKDRTGIASTSRQKKSSPIRSKGYLNNRWLCKLRHSFGYHDDSIRNFDQACSVLTRIQSTYRKLIDVTLETWDQVQNSRPYLSTELYVPADLLLGLHYGGDRSLLEAFR